MHKRECLLGIHKLIHGDTASHFEDVITPWLAAVFFTPSCAAETI